MTMFCLPGLLMNIEILVGKVTKKNIATKNTKNHERM